MVSPKPELDTGRGEQATDKGWHGSPVVLVLSAFPLTDTHTIYHSLYAGSKGKIKKKNKAADCVMLLCFLGIRFSSFLIPAALARFQVVLL
jgi:hypothetical protein